MGTVTPPPHGVGKNGSTVLLPAFPLVKDVHAALLVVPGTCVNVVQVPLTQSEVKQAEHRAIGNVGVPLPSPVNEAIAVFATVNFPLLSDCDENWGIETGNRSATVAFAVARAAFSGVPPGLKVPLVKFPISMTGAGTLEEGMDWPST